VLKTLGMELKGAPGTWAKGTEAVEDFLEEVGIARGSFVMKNGSGLNDTNRFSAAQLCKVIRFMVRRFGASPEFLSSLGIAGKDGTLRGRMEGTEAAGRLRAKTGTLEGTTALSGVVESSSGAHLVFAIIVNDIMGKHAPAVQGVDAIGVALASAGQLDAAAVNKLVSAPAASPVEELRARVTTYQSLGKLHSSYNLPFLRTALQTERDPAIRAAIAEAVFQSRKKDPKPDPLVERTLVEAWSNGPEVFGRLKTLAKDFNGEVPVVGALLDVAAGGQPEALAHVVGLAALSKDDPALTIALGDGLDQISRNAPDELLAAMKAAPPSDAAAALDLLAQGNAASTEAQPTPFPKAIEKAKTGKNVELAAYAKALEGDYATKLALARANPRPKPVDPGTMVPSTKP
jgi:D-alanyl-D-alanine carboxypeptidase/D-alanyl-D-alanine-endopeptidase (penicillin-binding protein 4)